MKDPATIEQTVKNLGFLIAPALTLLLGVCWLMVDYLNWPSVAAPLMALLLLYVVLPMADQLLGNDESQYRDNSQHQRWLNVLPPAMMAFQIFHVVVFLMLVVAATLPTALMLTLAAGVISSVSAINSAHELIHRPQRWKRTLGGLLLCTTAYPGFKIEHVRGHHRWVGTARDASSAARGMSLYRFLPRAIVSNCVNAWRLAEQSRKARQDEAASLWRRLMGNEALRWWFLTLCLALLLLAWLGLTALLFWVAHCAVAILTLETINYVEHYGLRRRRMDNGQYEPVQPHHSWNCARQLSNWMLLGLQRHSDHHAHAGRAFADLRHWPQAPQLPASYAAMMLLAMVPPLWRRVMDPRIPEHGRPTRAE